MQAGFLVRMVVLACTAVVGSAWGLAHFYTHMKEPMTVPLARDAGGGEAWDAGAGTVEIELEGR